MWEIILICLFERTTDALFLYEGRILFNDSAVKNLTVPMRKYRKFVEKEKQIILIKELQNYCHWRLKLISLHQELN